MQVPSEAIIRVLQGRARAEDVQALDSWRNSNPEHERLFQAMEVVWAEARWSESRAAFPPPPTVSDIIRRAEESDVVPITSSRLAPTQSAAGLGSNRHAQKRWKWRPMSRRLIAASVIGLVAGSLVTLATATRFTGRLFGGGDAVQFRTGAAEQATVSLPDGTIIRLAPDTELDVTSRADVREVLLSGEAYFAVAPDPGRRFVVRTEAAEVTVVGTRFNARARSESLDVAVVEGEVIVSKGGQEASAKANEIARVTSGYEPAVMSVDNVYAEISWLGGFLALRSTPLRDVMTELTQRFGVDVEVADEVLLDRTVTGWFADQAPEEIVSGVCRAVDAICQVQAGTTVMRAVPRQ